MTHTIVTATVSLVAIANPFVALPVYLNLRGGESADPGRTRRDAGRAALAVGLCLALSVVAGTAVLHAFGVSVAGLRTAGGLIVTLMAFHMVQGEQPGPQFSKGDERVAQKHSDEDLSIYVPLSIPLIAGPGAITTAISLAAGPRVGTGGALVAVLVDAVLVFLTIFFARFLYRLLGDFGLRLLTRIFGLLVMGVGVQMTVAGVRQLWTTAG